MGEKAAMNPVPETTLGFARRLVLLMVLIVVMAAIALANLSSEPVTDDLIARLDPANMRQRAYGWPISSYWRIATKVPGKIRPLSPTWPVRPQLQWPVSRYSAACLTANLATWLVMLAATSAACRWLLRRYWPRPHRRPRVSTLVVLMIVAAPTVLANLSFEFSPVSSSYLGVWRTAKASYGWPLIWEWYFVAPWDNLYGWDYSAARLAGNLVIWLVMLALVGLAWEWLLRRYRPRLQFSLRTMLAATALVAALCAWGTVAGNRAREQDALIAWAKSHNGTVWVERWGPKWLDLVGADRFRRCVTDVCVTVGHYDWAYQEEEEEDPEIDEEEPENAEQQDRENEDEEPEVDLKQYIENENRQQEELLKRLARLRGLRFLDVDLDCRLLTPAMATALGDLRQPRMLSIRCSGKAGERIAWLGNLTQLEQLWLSGVRRDDLAYLRGLTNLKSLTLDLSRCDGDEMRECLAAVGKVTQLQRLCLAGKIRSIDLAYLHGLTNLKSLQLDLRNCDGDEQRECLAAVGKLTQLQRLYLTIGKAHRDDLAYLAGLTNLKSLCLNFNDYVDDDAGLAELARLQSLEELTTDKSMGTAARLD